MNDESYNDVWSAPRESTPQEKQSFRNDVAHMADVLLALNSITDDATYDRFELATYGPLCRAIVKKYGSRSMLDTIRSAAVKLNKEGAH